MRPRCRTSCASSSLRSPSKVRARAAEVVELTDGAVLAFLYRSYFAQDFLLLRLTWSNTMGAFRRRTGPSSAAKASSSSASLSSSAGSSSGSSAGSSAERGAASSKSRRCVLEPSKAERTSSAISPVALSPQTAGARGLSRPVDASRRLVVSSSIFASTVSKIVPVRRSSSR